MYLSRRMQSGGGYAVYRQGLLEVLQIYNKVERKTSMNPCPTIMRFGRGYSNQMSPQGLKLSNPVNAGKYFSNGSNNSKMQSSPPNSWFSCPSWYSLFFYFYIRTRRKLVFCTFIFLFFFVHSSFWVFRYKFEKLKRWRKWRCVSMIEEEDRFSFSYNCIENKIRPTLAIYFIWFKT